MNIFVTGASGFLGRFLVPFLTEKGHKVIGISSYECDLCKRDSLKIFDAERFDQIYHLAAWTQAGDFCLRHPGEQWLINQKINTHMLDWWSEKQPQAQFIAMGTSCSYDPSYPLEEDYYLTGKPIESLFTYAMTKRMLLAGLMALQKQFGLNYLYIVPSTLYGGGYHTDGRQLHFIFDLIRKILRGHFLGDPVVLWGDGEQKRELVHVKDFIGALWELSQRETNTTINIGSGKEHSIREFAAIICQIAGYPPSKIEYDTSRYVGARSKVLSINKLTNILPQYTSRPLADGIREVVQWFLAHPELIDPALHAAAVAQTTR